MLILFFLISLIILLSTIGFGLIFTKFLKFENFNYNYGLVGILGLYILSIISSYSHLFSHTIMFIINNITDRFSRFIRFKQRNV